MPPHNSSVSQFFSLTKLYNKHLRYATEHRIYIFRKTKTPTFRSAFSGAAGGIRTLGRLLTVTRFPVVLVMTSSIPLQVSCFKQLVYITSQFEFCQALRKKFFNLFHGFHTSLQYRSGNGRTGGAAGAAIFYNDDKGQRICFIGYVSGESSMG